MNLNALNNDELKAALPAIKTKLEWQPKPVTRLSDKEKAEQVKRLRAIMASKQTPSVDLTHWSEYEQ
jgi:hypothetical protein